ncbi:MAG: hypothetical protein HKP41_03380 [Desulfobacterales bacterium]|nr:tripartite tricarboxylate transporter TctB family protein [Deltaproteobacteria bacterium]NNK93372.1 hypothetical protein [Desulfobacterales bacterium]
MTATQRDNLLFSGIVLTCVLFLVWVIPAYTPEYPGYGVPGSLVPNVAVSIILFLSLVALLPNVLSYFRAKRENQDRIPDKSPVDRVHLNHLLLFMVPSFLLMPIMKRLGFLPYDLGFILTGIIFMFILQWLCGQRKPVQLILVAVLPVGLIYVAIRYGLGVPMP